MTAREPAASDRLLPDPWLVRAAPVLLALDGPILDLACGSGRNALWMARNGARVVGVDASVEALSEARDQAHNLPARFLRREVSAHNFPSRPWAGIIVFHFLDRSLFPLLQSNLMPGGLLVYKTHLDHPLRSRRARPRRRAYLLRAGELLRSLPALARLDYREWARDGNAFAALLARRVHSS